jgi:CheY-like chemotaxis protein
MKGTMIPCVLCTAILCREAGRILRYIPGVVHPVREGARTSVTRVAATGSEKQPPEGNKQFALLVDGFVKDLFSTGIILQRLDYDVYIVNSAEDALRIMEAASPALVITELTLPRMSGLELLVRIKQDPKTREIPVIIHTANRDPKQESHCLAAKCAAFLKKPAEPDALYASIQHATEITPRQYIRLRTLLPANVGGRAAAGDDSGTEYVSELSEKGIFVHTLSPRPINTVVPVTMMIHSMPVRLKATVLYSIAMSPGLTKEPGMGMKFFEISPTDLELIRNFIKGQIMKDIPTQ